MEVMGNGSSCYNNKGTFSLLRSFYDTPLLAAYSTHNNEHSTVSNALEMWRIIPSIILMFVPSINSKDI
jgi:hypothetical protein